MASPSEFQPYRKVQGSAERELARILILTARSIEARVARLKPGIGGEVRAAQLRVVLSEIKKIQRAMWRGSITPAIQRQIDDAMKAGESAVEALTRVAYTALGTDASDTLVSGLRAAAQSGFLSDAARRKKALSARVYKIESLSENKVEDIIRQGLISGLSARELAKDVYDHISPTTKGGASYSAMRLARTEINNAFHERQIAGATRPGVDAVKWNLSGSHKVPDECNVYAAHKPYAPDKVPEKPHPQCFCYLTYVISPPEEFKKELEAGKWDDELDRRTKENLARLGQPVGDVTPESTAKSNVPGNDALAKSIKGGIAESTPLSGGKQAQTTKVEFKDGTSGVRKHIDRSDGKRQQDAEELVPLLARMMGIKAPQVVRTDKNTTVQRFLPGKLASSLVYDGLPTRYKQRVKEAANNDQGYLIAILDQITYNMDRHEGNWLIGDDGDLTVIDHGLAWTNMRGQTDLSEAKVFRMNDPFSGLITTGKIGAASYKPKMDIHPDDIDAIGDMLNALRPEFEARGQIEWWEFSLKQLEAIRPHAQGKKRRIKS